MLAENDLKKTVVLVVLRGDGRIGDVFAFERFGKLEKLLNITSYVCKCLNHLKARSGKGCQQVQGELELEAPRKSKRKYVQYEQAIIKTGKEY